MYGRRLIGDRPSKVVVAVGTWLVIAVGTSSLSAQQARTGGPTPSPEGAAVHFVGLNDGATLPTKANPLRAARYGSCARRLRAREFGSSSPANRYRAAAPRPAHSQRLQSSPLRCRSDRGRDYAETRNAHSPTTVWRQGSHSAHSAADVSTDSSRSSRSRNRENNCAADP